MAKLFKAIVYLVGILIVLLLLGIFLLTTLVNPNDFKPQISRQVQQLTGRQLTINGKLSWTFFPALGININDVALSNAPGFPEPYFIKVQQAEISVNVLPLLHGNIELGQLTLDRMILNLSKNKAGVTNWQDLMQAKATNNKTNEKSPSNSSNHFKLASLTLSGVQIKQATINFRDAQTGKNISLNNMNFSAKNVSLYQPFPISFDTMLQTSALPKPINVSLDTVASLNAAKQQINLKQLKFNFANVKILGDMVVQSFITAPKITGNFTIPTFNANQTLNALGKPSNLAELNSLAANFQLVATKSRVAINQLQAQILQGVITGNLGAAISGATPGYTINMNIQNMPIEPLLASFAQKTHLQMSGNANGVVKLTTAGNNPAAIKQNLNGTIQFAISNGVLHGIDIAYYSNLADAIANKSQPTKANTGTTPFSKMAGSVQFNRGIASNNDLIMMTSLASVTGKGTANLLTEQLNYEMQLQRLTSGATVKPRGPAVPISITGSFAKPEIRPNWSALTTTLIKSALQDQISKRLGDSQLGQQLQQGLSSLLGN